MDRTLLAITDNSQPILSNMFLRICLKFLSNLASLSTDELYNFVSNMFPYDISMVARRFNKRVHYANLGKRLVDL